MSSSAPRRPPRHRALTRWGAVGAASAVVGVGALALPGTGPALARPPEPGPAPSIPLEDPVSVAPAPSDGATPAPDTSRIAEDGIRPLQYWLDE
jgi:membrane-anchored mycosin MYCP